MSEEATVLKVDESLGLVFGWAIISKENGVDYYDTQGDHIPEPVMLKSSSDFMANSRIAADMHRWDKDRNPITKGSVVFAFPLTEDVAKAMEITTKRTGLMIAMKPEDPEVLAKFVDGTYTGFSVGGIDPVYEAVE